VTQEHKISYEEPKTFGIAKFRLYYSAIAIIVIVGALIFDKEPTPPICFGAVVVLAVYLFLPFTYRLIVSDEAISSINFLGAKTLEWNEIADIGLKKGNLILSNRDADVKVTVNQQIDDYPEVIKFIKQQRPELWRLDEVNPFHQSYLENALSVLIGFGILIMGGWLLFRDGLTTDSASLILIVLGSSVFLVLHGLLRIRKLSLDQDFLVVHYLVWKRQFHVNDVWSVSLEQEYGKNIVTYPVHIRIRDRKDIVVENVKEGNPILVNAIEMWMSKYKGKQNDQT
jgi:hypothetical protein